MWEVKHDDDPFNEYFDGKKSITFIFRLDLKQIFIFKHHLQNDKWEIYPSLLRLEESIFNVRKTLKMEF